MTLQTQAVGVTAGMLLYEIHGFRQNGICILKKKESVHRKEDDARFWNNAAPVSNVVAVFFFHNPDV